MATGDGLIVMTPTSISFAGTSATITSDGGVTFTDLTSLSVNGIFTSAFTNYVMFINSYNANSGSLTGRLRASGVDATGANYNTQDYNFSGAGSGTAENLGLSTGYFGNHANYCGLAVYIYGPYLTAPTMWRSITMSGLSNAYAEDWLVGHDLSNSYDGLTFGRTSGAITGSIVVMGYEE